LGNPYWFRDLTSKLTRRVKKLIGRPDPTPWVVRPTAPTPVSPVTITGLPADAPFVRAMHEACSPRNVPVYVVPDQHPPSIQVAGLTLGPIDRAAALSKLNSAGIDLTSTTTPGYRALVRAFILFGDQSLLGLVHTEPPRYEPVTWADVRAHQLTPAFELIDRARRATGLEFFALDIGVANGQLTPIAFAEEASWIDAAPLFTWLCERIADRACRPEVPDQGHGVWLSPTLSAAASTSPAVLQALVNAA
jgi:hypothetical protein